MSAKPAKPAKSPSPRFDIERASLFFERDGRTYKIDLLPIDDSVIVRLALERIYQLVRRSRDPLTKSDWIKSGRPKNIQAPNIVKAISHASNRPIGEVLTVWRKLSKDEKKKLAADPVVIASLKRLETPHNPQPTDLYLDIFG